MAQAKQTMQVMRMVATANRRLKANKVNFANKYKSDWFNVVETLLISAGVYKGFVECYEKHFSDGRVCDTLVGNDNVSEDEKFIQFLTC